MRRFVAASLARSARAAYSYECRRAFIYVMSGERHSVSLSFISRYLNELIMAQVAADGRCYMHKFPQNFIGNFDKLD